MVLKTFVLFEISLLPEIFVVTLSVDAGPKPLDVDARIES